MIVGVHHVGLVARNLERLAAFYRDAIGFVEVAAMEWSRGSPEVDQIVGVEDSAARLVMMRLGGVMLELFEYSSPTIEGSAADRQPYHRGYAHLCLDVTDIDAEYERLRAMGMTAHAPPPAPVLGMPMRAIYMRDPEGNIVELQEIHDRAHPFYIDRGGRGTVAPVDGGLSIGRASTDSEGVAR
jgi:catechol 2,3-dioxygenase-like lactoylglutathione lyase family enzyme